MEKLNSEEKFVNFDAWLTDLKEFIFTCKGQLKLL